jgi:hypothetical protein
VTLDDEAAEGKPIVVTHSDISQYLRCRRAWAWHYVHRYSVPEVRWGAAQLGSRVHSALEAHYKHGIDPIEEHNRLGRVDVDAVDADPTTPPWALDNLYKDIVIGHNCLLGWRKWQEETGADHGLDVVAVEEMIETPILDGSVILRGKVDLLRSRVSNGALVMTDWKTTSPFVGVNDMLLRSYQHWVYLAILAAVYPDRVILEAEYLLLIKGTTTRIGTIDVLPIPATTRGAPRKLQQIELIVRDMVWLMGVIREFPELAYPSPTENCRWCDFKRPCDLADDVGYERAEEMLEELYIKGTLHARYNK